MRNVSTAFKYSESDAKLISAFMHTEPRNQMEFFRNIAEQLSDYAYWFLLSTMWVNESNVAPISVWKELFSSKRSNRSVSVMKPDELTAFKRLPSKLKVYRVHSEAAPDWISYTLDSKTAIQFSGIKDVREFTEYRVKKYDCLGLFLRRGEAEIVCLDKELAKPMRVIKVCSGANV